LSPKTAPPDAPAWRKLVQRLDRTVTPPADAFVRTNLFADSIAALTRLEVQVRRRLERQTTAYLHLFNLPTAGDVKRVRAQLAVMEARLRDLNEQLNDQAQRDREASKD
jgi:hypothetical protein